MPKDIDADYLKYFYQSGVTILTGYKFSLVTEDDTKFVANSEDIGTYTALAVKRNAIRSEEGTILNELEIGLDHVDLTFKNDVMSGKYNNKKIKVYLVFAHENFAGNWLVDYEMLLYTGYTDEPKGDEHWITISIKPFPYLNRQYPKRIYQSGCNWTFCGSSCGLSLSTYITNVNLSATSNGVILTCAHGEAVDYFIPGYVEIKNGALAGQVRPILQNDASTVTVRVPFDSSIPSGINVDVVKLCSKNYETCENDFSNYSEYGGYPWVPKEPLI